MKKLGKISSLMFTFAALANNSLATTEAPTAITPVATAVQETAKVNITPLAIGALLICCVLFIGYKMDKEPEREQKMKAVKVPKVKKEKKRKVEEVTEKEEAEIYDNENRNDIPYEKDVNEYYEKDFDIDNAGLNEDSEYEEDDVEIFMPNEDVVSSFENSDDDILFRDNVVEPVRQDNFNSTMVFNSDELNNELNNEANRFESEEFFGIRPKFEDNVEETVEEAIEDTIENEDDFEYTDPVEGLDEKISSLDDLDDYKVEFKEEEQDAESFMNELKKYELAEDDGFEGFTTKNTAKEEEKVVTKKAPKRYTKKKVVQDLPMVEENVSSMDYVEDVDEPDLKDKAEVEMSFLAQMEQNLKREQESRLKKSSKTTKTTKTAKKEKVDKEEKPKKSTTKKSTTKSSTKKTTAKKTTKKKEE